MKQEIRKNHPCRESSIDPSTYNVFERSKRSKHHNVAAKLTRKRKREVKSIICDLKNKKYIEHKIKKTTITIIEIDERVRITITTKKKSRRGDEQKKREGESIRREFNYC